jgi:hypothetical protein
VHAPPSGAAAHVVRMQQTLGNAHVQRMLAQRSGAGPADPGVAASIADARGGGAGLGDGVRGEMESAFGADFRGVRVHTDARADTLSRALGARAFATGSDLFFRAGEFAPSSPGGKKLLAHELTHVVQQGGTAPAVQRELEVGDPDDAYEREAERAADAVAARRPAEATRGAAGVQRFEAPVHEAADRSGTASLANPRGDANTLGVEESTAVYFGNWQRDINQFFVPMARNLFGDDVIFSLVSYMAAKKFGRFMTPGEFGYYIPAEHIDNPAGLTNADDVLPSQPVIAGESTATGRPAGLDTPQEDVEPTGRVGGAPLFSVDQAGVMAFIRRSNFHVERRLDLAATSGRNPTGLMHFGAALHAIEDLFAHSNWVEIAVNKLLAENPALLPDLQGEARRAFTFSNEVDVGEGGRRPVLTTGSFTGTDTQISAGSEVVKFMSEPLPDPAGNEEAQAMERMMTTLLRDLDRRKASNPALQATLRGLLREAGVPEMMIGTLIAIPLATVYSLRLPIPIPDALRLPIQRAIRRFVSENALQPAAAELRAAGLQARVADTSLVRVLREQQAIAAGNFSPAVLARERALANMGAQGAAAQGTPDQILQRRLAAARVEAARHVAALQATPEAVVAGPSHSMISKDHVNSPFFGVAFTLAEAAVQRMRTHMLAVWNENGPSTPWSFDFPAWPAATERGGEARALFHERRPFTGAPARQSLRRGNDIVANGGEGAPYDLAAMRHHSAERIRRAAGLLRAASGGPQTVAGLLQQVAGLLGGMAANDPRMRRVQDELIAAAAAISQGGAQANQLLQPAALAATLDGIAQTVEGARSHAQREAANARLMAGRADALRSLTSANRVLAAAVLLVLDEEIQNTAVSFSGEQRRILESGATDLLPEHTGPRQLAVHAVAWPSLQTDGAGGTRSPARVALIAESRRLLNHPYESDWWRATLTRYIQTHAARIRTDIEARNAGYAVLFHPGQGSGHGHP